ncbi:hypothetical protein [Amycolatopsis sp. NPDC049159]|uniref:hypothetical protein n=1 Tax=Amycolatopsis sp. NPDC049159 TaxID=3157210 RepID=UPI0033D24224
MRVIVLPEFPGESRGKNLDERTFEHLRRYEHEGSVAGALVLAVEPGYAGLLEGTTQREVETLPDHQPVRRGPPLVTISFDIHREHRAMDDQS